MNEHNNCNDLSTVLTRNISQQIFPSLHSPLFYNVWFFWHHACVLGIYVPVSNGRGFHAMVAAWLLCLIRSGCLLSAPCAFTQHKWSMELLSSSILIYVLNLELLDTWCSDNSSNRSNLPSSIYFLVFLFKYHIIILT